MFISLIIFLSCNGLGIRSKFFSAFALCECYSQPLSPLASSHNSILLTFFSLLLIFSLFTWLIIIWWFNPSIEFGWTTTSSPIVWPMGPPENETLEDVIHLDSNQRLWKNPQGVASEGISAQKIWAISTFMVALLTNRTVNFPHFLSLATSYTYLIPNSSVPYDIPFHHIIDYKHFQRSFLPSKIGLLKYPDASFTQIDHWEKGLNAMQERAVTFGLGKWTEAIFKSKAVNDFVGNDVNVLRRLRLNIVRNIKHAPWIRELADLLIHEMTKSQDVKQFTCIHVRLEEDFAKFCPYDTYSLEKIIFKIYNTKSWWGLQFPTLYIAGYYKNVKPMIQQFQSLGIWNHITSKDVLLPPDHPMRSGDGMPQTFPAVVDHEVCQRSSSFIGNSHSSWSELIFDNFMANGCEDCARQVNNQGGNNVTLIPFCSSQMNLFYGVPCSF